MRDWSTKGLVKAVSSHRLVIDEWKQHTVGTAQYIESRVLWGFTAWLAMQRDELSAVVSAPETATAARARPRESLLPAQFVAP